MDDKTSPGGAQAPLTITAALAEAGLSGQPAAQPAFIGGFVGAAQSATGAATEPAVATQNPAPIVTAAPIAPPAAAAPAAPAPTPAVDGAAERTRAAEITAIAAQAATMGVTVDAARAINEGTTPDELRRAVLGAAAQRDAATAIVTTAAPLKAGVTSAIAPEPEGDSSLVAAARRLAEQQRTRGRA